MITVIESIMTRLAKKVFSSNLMSEVSSFTMLQEAFDHIYKKRKEDHHNSDIWSLSLRWKNIKEQIKEKLLSGKYLLSPIKVLKGSDEKYYSRWTSEDNVVLKALSIALTGILQQKVSNKCCHLKGNGGVRGAVKKINNEISNHKFVVKSDVADFYKSMNHKILLAHCKKIIKDKRIIKILKQYMNRLEDVNGEYNLVSEGISKGCPLSPLMGAIILESLDTEISENFTYARYMDDWVILTRTRGALRRIVKKMHKIMKELKFKLALDKTYIGKISNGFDFLGYRFGSEGIKSCLPTKTIRGFINKTTMLYELKSD